jgi:hypothetical protein
MLMHNAAPHLDLDLVTILNQLTLIYSYVMVMREIFLSVKEQLVTHASTQMMQVSFAIVRMVQKFPVHSKTQWNQLVCLNFSYVMALQIVQIVLEALMKITVPLNVQHLVKCNW